MHPLLKRSGAPGFPAKKAINGRNPGFPLPPDSILPILSFAYGTREPGRCRIPLTPEAEEWRTDGHVPFRPARRMMFHPGPPPALKFERECRPLLRSQRLDRSIIPGGCRRYCRADGPFTRRQRCELHAVFTCPPTGGSIRASFSRFAANERKNRQVPYPAFPLIYSPCRGLGRETAQCRHKIRSRKAKSLYERAPYFERA